MRRIALISAISALMLVLAACQGGASTSPAASPAASAAGPSLTGGTWKLAGWTEVAPAGQSVVPPGDVGKYTITFNADGSAAIKADCNNVTATYTASTAPGEMKITLGASTMAACGDQSLDAQYLAKLALVSSWKFEGSDLILTQSDGGTMSFAA